MPDSSFALVGAWLIVLAGLVVAALGVVLPVLPGVPVALLATVLAGWLTGFDRIGVETIVWVAVLAALAQGFDVLGNVIGARRFGAGRAGLWGGAIGSIVGLVLLPPWGFLLGAFAGATGFEALAGRPLPEAWRAGVGALLGTLAGVGGKLVVVVVIAIVVIGRLVGA
jgi:uncharacterized protein YqgC (DUF456 family)